MLTVRGRSVCPPAADGDEAVEASIGVLTTLAGGGASALQSKGIEPGCPSAGVSGCGAVGKKAGDALTATVLGSGLIT